MLEILRCTEESKIIHEKFASKVGGVVYWKLQRFWSRPYLQDITVLNILYTILLYTVWLLMHAYYVRLHATTTYNCAIVVCKPLYYCITIIL